MDGNEFFKEATSRICGNLNMGNLLGELGKTECVPADNPFNCRQIELTR